MGDEFLASCHSDLSTRSCRWELGTDINKRRLETQEYVLLDTGVSKTCDFQHREVIWETEKLSLEQEIKKKSLDSEY